jgi:sulfopyruvate decarboxylase TPP-binding subunit
LRRDHHAAPASTPRDEHARFRRRNSRRNVQETGTSQDRAVVAQRIADQLAGCGVRLVASLPDNWLTPLIDTVAGDSRFTHVAVNREESAVGLCSGATMGASGFMTVIYAITKINYSYEIPLFMLITLRGAFGDHHKHHVSNGLYLRPVMDAINLPYTIVGRAEEIPQISRAYRHSRTYVRPVVVALTRDLLR